MEEPLFAQETVEDFKKEEPWDDYPQEVKEEINEGYGEMDPPPSPEMKPTIDPTVEDSVDPNGALPSKEPSRELPSAPQSSTSQMISQSSFRWKCPVVGCGPSFRQIRQLHAHMLEHLPTSPTRMTVDYGIPRGTLPLQMPGKMRRTADTPTPFTWRCPFGACGAFQEEKRLLDHLDTHRGDNFIAPHKFSPDDNKRQFPKKDITASARRCTHADMMKLKKPSLLVPEAPKLPKSVVPSKHLNLEAPNRLKPEVPPEAPSKSEHSTCPWMCPVKDCKTGFYLFPVLMKHMRSSHPRVAPIWCPSCPSNYWAPGNYSAHMKEQHGVYRPEEDPAGYRCEECRAHFPTRAKYYHHCQYYKGTPHFFCNACKVHVYTAEVQKHILSDKHRQFFKITDDIKCKECSKTFCNASHYTAHCSTYSGKPHKFCKPCNQPVLVAEWKKHQETKKHRVVLNLPLYQAVCEECGKIFDSVQVHTTHKKHFTNRPHVYCEPCNLVMDREDWDDHQFMGKHKKNCGKKEVPEENGEGDTCEECGRRFQLKSQCQTHREIFKERPHFYCQPCETCVDREKREKHEMMKMHRVRTTAYEEPLRWKCPVEECEAAFTIVRLLEEHMAQHPGQLPFRCDLCPQQFGYNGRLKRHMEKEHAQGTLIDS